MDKSILSCKLLNPKRNLNYSHRQRLFLNFAIETRYDGSLVVPTKPKVKYKFPATVKLFRGLQDVRKVWNQWELVDWEDKPS
jgi:hypothetical protein